MLRKIIHTVSEKIKRLKPSDILIGLVLLISLLFFMFRFSRKSEYVFVDLTFEREGYASNFYPPEYWQVEQIKTGDKVYNALGNEVAKVTEVQRVAWGGGTRLYTYITLQLNALYNTATKTYSHDGQQLVIGEKTHFTINNSGYTGIIRNIYKDKSEKEKSLVKKDAQLQIMCRNYDEPHAEAIVNLAVYDSNGRVLAEVINATISPAATYEPNQSGFIVRGSHPDKKDIELSVLLHDVSCATNNICFYNQTQTFMIGNEFWLDSGKTFFGRECLVEQVELFDKHP